MAVDTNILFDLVVEGAPDQDASTELLRHLAERDGLIVCEAVVAELAPQFDSENALAAFLSDVAVDYEPSSTSALYQAGVRWREYAARRGTGVLCAECGARTELSCSECGTTIAGRQHIVADFLIGAHASVHADALVSRDRGFYRAYFAGLKLL